jgi:hypothetical protein
MADYTLGAHCMYVHVKKNKLQLLVCISAVIFKESL